MHRRHHAVSLQQAAQESPTLSTLTGLVRDSSLRLRAVESLIPESLHASVKAGPVTDSEWCLLVSSTAAAAKIRQLLPALLSHLRSQGWKVNSIRLKVQTK